MKKWMITLMLIGAMLLSLTETALAIGTGDVWQVTPIEMLFHEDCDKSSLTFEDTGSVTRATESLTHTYGHTDVDLTNVSVGFSFGGTGLVGGSIATNFSLSHGENSWQIGDTNAFSL